MPRSPVYHNGRETHPLPLGRSLCRFPGDEDELKPGPVGGVPDLVDDQTGRGQRVSELAAAGNRSVESEVSTAPSWSNGPGAELAGQSGIGIEIGTVRVQRIVNLRQPGHLEMRISHAKNPTAGAWALWTTALQFWRRMSARQIGKSEILPGKIEQLGSRPAGDRT